MHHEVPECRKMLPCGEHCTLLIKVNRLSSGKKKKSINSLQFGALFLDVLFLSTALSVPGWLINIFSGGEFIPGLAREGDGFMSLILRFTALCH